MRQFYTLPALKKSFTFKQEQREHQNRILGSL